MDILNEVATVSPNEGAVPDGISVVLVRITNHTGTGTELHTKDTVFFKLCLAFSSFSFLNFWFSFFRQIVEKLLNHSPEAKGILYIIVLYMLYTYRLINWYMYTYKI